MGKLLISYNRKGTRLDFSGFQVVDATEWGALVAKTKLAATRIKVLQRRYGMDLGSAETLHAYAVGSRYPVLQYNNVTTFLAQFTEKPLTEREATFVLQMFGDTPFGQLNILRSMNKHYDRLMSIINTHSKNSVKGKHGKL